MNISAQNTSSDFAKYTVLGWDKAEKGGTWSLGKDAELAMSITDYKQQDLQLTVQATPYLTEQIAEQVVEVSVNGTNVDEWHMDKAGEYTTIIPASLVHGGVLNVKLHDKNADLSLPKEGRALGIFMQNMTINDIEIEKYNLTANISAQGISSDFAKYTVSGWDKAEDSGTWSLGKDAEFAMKITDYKSQNLQLTIQAVPYITDQINEQVVDVSVNGTNIAEWHMDKAGEYTTIIPARLVQGGLLKVKLHDKNADLSYVNEGRAIGIFMQNVVLNEIKSEKFALNFLLHANKTSQEFDKYAVAGWDQAEENGTKSIAKKAICCFDLGQSLKQDLTLKVEAGPYTVTNKAEETNVNIIVNNQMLATWNLQTDGKYEAIIPANLIKTGFLTICFDISDFDSNKNAPNILLKSLILESKEY